MATFLRNGGYQASTERTAIFGCGKSIIERRNLGAKRTRVALGKSDAILI